MKHYYDTVANQSNILVPNANVTVFVAGTLTLAPLFSDDGLTPTTNPVLTNALGVFNFYVADGRYDITVSGPNIGTFTQANVEISDVTEAGPGTSDQSWQTEFLQFAEQSLTSPTPPAGFVSLYSKASDGNLYYKKPSGVEIGPLTSGSGSGSLPAGPNGSIQVQSGGLFGAGPLVSTVAIKPMLPGDPIQYVSPNGNDGNDGLSLGSAKLTVYAALQALPGGSLGVAGSGTVWLSGNVNYGGPVGNQGFWLMGPSDPNFASPPTGWLKSSGLGLTLDCVAISSAPLHGHRNTCGLHAGGLLDSVHPAVWISAVASQVEIRNLTFIDSINVYIKYGIDSNNIRSGSGGSSGLGLENVAWNHGACRAGGGPGMDIGSNSSWIWMRDIVASGCVKAIFTVAPTGATRVNNVTTLTCTSPHNILTGDTVSIQNVGDYTFNTSAVATVVDGLRFSYPNFGPNTSSGNGQVITQQASAINIEAGGGGGSNLIFIDNINLNNGGIRLNPGTNGGSLYVHNIGYQGDLTDSDMSPVSVVRLVNPTNVKVEHLEVANTSVSVKSVRVDNAFGGNPGSVVFDGLDITTPSGNPVGSSPLRSGILGFSNGLIAAGGIDVARRGFSPIATPGANLASTNPSSWSFNGGSGTISTGIAAPDGTSNAGRVTATTASLVQFYLTIGAPANVGDAYVYGVWARSVSGTGYLANAAPVRLALNSSGFGVGATCTNGTPTGQILWPGLASPPNIDGQWQWFSGICKIASNPSGVGLLLAGGVDVPSAVDFYNPTLLYVPVGTKSDNEIWELANNFSAISSAASLGEVSMLPGQILRPGSVAFANLPASNNGAFVYCTDCTATAPCAGNGSGAFASRLNNSWLCANPLVVPPSLSFPNSGIFYLAQAIVNQTALQTLGDATTGTVSGGSATITNGVPPTATDGTSVPVSIPTGGYFAFRPNNGLVRRSGRNSRYQARFSIAPDTHISGLLLWFGLTDQTVSNMRTNPPTGPLNLAAIVLTGAAGSGTGLQGAVANSTPGNYSSITLTPGNITLSSIVGNSTFLDIIMDDVGNTTSFYVNGLLGGVISGNNPLGANSANWVPMVYFTPTDTNAHLLHMEYFFSRADF